jgi:hypothetical protein
MNRSRAAAEIQTHGGPLRIRPIHGFLKLLAIAYLLGVGVALEPTIRDNWQSSTMVLWSNVVSAMPEATAWPVNAVRALMAR